MSRRSDKLRNEILYNGLELTHRENRICVYGYTARMAGHPRSQCPYIRREDPQRFDLWMLGWDNADNDKKGGKS